MRDQQQHELVDAHEAAPSEPAGAERNRHLQRQTRNQRAETGDRPRPLEFDESGFPIAQRSPSFATRVARLLSA
jgi:hypothetical protein